MSRFKTNEDFFAYAKTLSVIPTEDLLALLNRFKIKIPTYVHRFVLKETIAPKVFQTKLYQSYTDELQYRLRGYNDYSLFLLEKLITDYNLDFDAAMYKEILFDMLFLNRELYNLKNSFYDELEKLKYKYTVDFEKISYHDFIAQFRDIIYEPKGYLDGINLKILKDVLVHSCTLGDLKGLGEKYGVKVPRRINKAKLIAILAARFRLTEEEANLLDDKSVLELEIYAKEKGFNISIDLKKSDMVEFIIYDLKMYHQEVQKDLHDYNIPLVSDADQVKVEAIEFQTNDQDIPVVETEEVEEPVIDEEPPVEIEEEEVAPVIVPEPEPEPVVEPEPEPKPEVKPVEAKKQEPTPEAKPKPAKPQTQVEPVVSPQVEVFSDEEKDLLDEKINLIIKKYHQRRRRRRFWTIFSVCLIILVLGFVGYSYLYYTTINPGNLPFNIPVFW
ncbi:MAG: hypothetical protein JXB20_02250 [Bacilli bacterium]|nr:hypothetical protein [Bacilli bacterium]